MSRAHEDNVRTAAERLRAAHRGVDPELARLVVRRGDDTASVRVAADDERLRAQVGILELLHSGEEGVEVEMGDDHARSLRRRLRCRLTDAPALPVRPSKPAHWLASE